MRALILLIALVLPASVLAENVTFQWDFDPAQADANGFKLYMGDTSDSTLMDVVTDVQDGNARSVVFNFTSNSVKCFGISAYNGFGESDITTSGDGGQSVCLGKPSAPTSFSFTAP